MLADRRTGASAPLIVHVIHHLHMGGLENGVVNLVNRMPPDRYRHCVLCIEDYSEFRNRIERSDVDVIALHRSTMSALQLYHRLHTELRRLKPDIVHSRNLSGLDALLPAMLAGVPHRIQSEHGWDVADLDGTLLRPRLLRRLHSPLVNQYVTVSKNLQHYLVDRVGIASSRICQIYNGVDTDRFTPVTSKPPGILPSEFYGQDKLVVGTVGRLQAVKDQQTLIRAVGRLVRQWPQQRARVRLAIVGEGAMREVLQSCVHAEEIADLVWLPGARNDTALIYRCLDVFALPSLNEGISNTLLEAMASGLPAVATAVGGNVELVAEGDTGRLIPPGDDEFLAAALHVYAADESLRLAHGSAGRTRAISTFSIGAMIESYLRLYDSRCAPDRPA